MTFMIQASEFPDQKITVTINNDTYTIRLKFASAGSCWYMSLFDYRGTTLSAGRRIKSGVSILPSSFLGGLDGNFMANPITIVEENLGRYPWGNTHELIYTENE